MLVILSGLFVILLAFKKYAWLSESKVGQTLQYIGRYTMDIYFIHYFFIPRRLYMVGYWFRSYSNPIIELLLAICIAALLIIASIAVSKIIRMSPALSHWLLGVKKKQLNA